MTPPSFRQARYLVRGDTVIVGSGRETVRSATTTVKAGRGSTWLEFYSGSTRRVGASSRFDLVRPTDPRTAEWYAVTVKAENILEGDFIVCPEAPDGAQVELILDPGIRDCVVARMKSTSPITFRKQDLVTVYRAPLPREEDSDA